jgi:hypothetical protein
MVLRRVRPPEDDLSSNSRSSARGTKMAGALVAERTQFRAMDLEQLTGADADPVRPALVALREYADRRPLGVVAKTYTTSTFENS